MPERESTSLRAAHTSGEWVKTGAALIGVLVLSSYGLGEALVSVGWSLGDCPSPDGIPWGQLIVGGILIAPKLLGADRASNLLGRMLPGKRGDA